MTAAAKALDALAVQLDQRWEPATWVNDDGEWCARGPLRVNRMPSIRDGESVNDFESRLYAASHMPDNEAGCDGDQQARADAERMCLSVNLSAPLAAVVRAAMKVRETWSAGWDCSNDVGHRDHCFAIDDLVEAIESLEAAARAQGFAP